MSHSGSEAVDMQRPTGGRPSLVVGIIIPARNEALALGQVLAELPRTLIHQVIVVDNGSTDGTARIAKEIGALVVREPVPGYGRACLAGIAALEEDIDTLVFLDADHSDYPEQIPQLLAPIARGEADLVIGSRIAHAQARSLTLQQRFGNRLACFLIDRLFGFRYTDLGPFRAIRRDALARLHMQDQAFGWTVEMQTKAILHGLRIVEVPVRYRPRIGRSKISGTVRGTIMAGVAIIFTILKIRVRELAGRSRLKAVGSRQGQQPPTSSLQPRASSSSSSDSNHLLIFLKYPTPGTVKTRLAGEMDEEAAAAIYRASTELTLERLGRLRAQTVVYGDPSDALARIRSWLGADWLVRAQHGDDLGARLTHATGEAFREGAARVVVIGTDSPWIGPEQIATAFSALERSDLVIGPTDDGGYYLLGLSKPVPALFEGVAWSSPQVYAQTMAKAQALGLSVHVLPRGYDLDYAADVERFLDEERRRGHTSALLDTIETLIRVQSARSNFV